MELLVGTCLQHRVPGYRLQLSTKMPLRVSQRLQRLRMYAEQNGLVRSFVSSLCLQFNVQIMNIIIQSGLTRNLFVLSTQQVIIMFLNINRNSTSCPYIPFTNRSFRISRSRKSKYHYILSTILLLILHNLAFFHKCPVN